MLILFYFFLRKHRFARFCFMFYTPGFGNFRGEIDFFLLFEIMEFFGKLRVMISRVGGKLWWRDILRKINIRGWDSLHFYDCSKNCHVWKNYFLSFFTGNTWYGLDSFWWSRESNVWGKTGVCFQKQMILVLDFDQRSSSRCLETKSRIQGQKRIKYNEARIW